MNKKITTVLLLWTLGVIGLSPSVIAGAGCGKMSGAQRDEIAREVRAQMQQRPAQAATSAEVIIQAAPAPRFLICTICEQRKVEGYFSISIQRPCHRQHSICNSCFNPNLCDACSNEIASQQRQQRFATVPHPQAPGGPTHSATLSSSQQQPVQISLESGQAVQLSVLAARESDMASSRADSAPISAIQVPANDEITFFFKKLGGTAQPLTIDRKLISENIWTIGHLKEMLKEQIQWEGTFSINGKEPSNDALLSQFPWVNGVTTLYAQGRLNGGEVSDPVFEIDQD